VSRIGEISGSSGPLILRARVVTKASRPGSSVARTPPKARNRSQHAEVRRRHQAELGGESPQDGDRRPSAAIASKQYFEFARIKTSTLIRKTWTMARPAMMCGHRPVTSTAWSRIG
jgi:hypothetical protein